MFRIWIRAIFPGLTPVKARATYEALLQEKLGSGFGKALAWIAIGGVVAGVIQAFLTFVSGILEELPFASLLQTSLAEGIRVPISTLIEYLVTTVAIYIVARVLAGKGNLNDQSYLLAAIQAPMTILFAITTLVVAVAAVAFVLLGIPPELAGLLVFPLAIYAGWLVVVSLRASHRFSATRAIFTLLLASIVLWPAYSLFT